MSFRDPCTKNAPTDVGALIRIFGARFDLLSAFEDGKAAARELGRDVAAGKSDVRVCVVQRIRAKAWLIIIGIDRSRSEIIGANRVVWRERAGRNFVQADASSSNGSAEAFDKSRGRRVRAFKHSRLLHRAAKFAPANDFSSVAQAATKLFLGFDAAGSQEAGDGRGSKKS